MENLLNPIGQRRLFVIQEDAPISHTRTRLYLQNLQSTRRRSLRRRPLRTWTPWSDICCLTSQSPHTVLCPHRYICPPVPWTYTSLFTNIVESVDGTSDIGTDDYHGFIYTWQGILYDD